MSSKVKFGRWRRFPVVNLGAFVGAISWAKKSRLQEVVNPGGPTSLPSGSAAPFNEIGAEKNPSTMTAMVSTSPMQGFGVDLIRGLLREGRCSSAKCFESLSHYQVPVGVAVCAEAALEVH